MRSKFRRITRLIGYHTLVLIRGLAKMLYGTAAAALLALGIYGFIMVPSEGGYAAVFDFLGSVSIIVIALVAIYVMGGNIKKGARK